MEWLVSTLVGNSVIACAIASGAALAMLLRRPALAHVLWLLVLVKLVTPPLFRVPVNVPSWGSADASTVAEAVIPSAGIAGEPEVSPAAPARGTHAHPTPAVVAPPRQGLPGASTVWFGTHGVTVLLITWAAGTATYVAVTAVRTRRFARALRDAGPADPAVIAHARDLADRLGLSNVPDVRVIERASSPMVVGMGGAPLLILPAPLVARLGGDQLRTVVAHELAHLRRRDHWVRWLETAATAVLWWHPLLWLTRRGLHEAEEQSCDAWVVWALPGARRAYADALVTTAALLSEAAEVALPPGTSGLGQFQHLRRRLVMVMHRTTRHGLSLPGKLIATGILLALPILPAVAERTTGEPAGAAGVATGPPDEATPPLSEIPVLSKIPHVGRLSAAADKDAGSDQSKEDANDKDKKESEDEEQAGDKAPRAQIDAEIAKARARMRQDARRYSQQQLKEAEQLYQVANKQWRSPEAKASLETMVKKYPKFNRTGCATLYLGQYAEGAEKEKYLTQAVERFGDCYYGNGVQVGAFARYLLGHYYRDNGEVEKGNALLKEVVQKFPKSVTHRGDQLAKIAKQDMELPPPPK